MKKIVILFAVLNCWLSINAQAILDTTDHVRIGLTEAEFQRAKDGYVKMVESETYKNRIIATDKIIEKYL